MKSSHTVIIGNGISGVTTARHLRKRSNDPITIISGESDHFYSRTALMYIFMGHMRYKDTKPYEDSFWKKNKINLRKDWVTKIDFENQLVHFHQGNPMKYDKLVLATGSKPNKFGWTGQESLGVQGLYSLQDLESMEAAMKRGVKKAVIVGGGLIGVEMAEMLQSRGVEVCFLVRESRFWGNVLPREEAEMIGHHMVKDHHVDLRLEKNLDSIQADEEGWVKSVKIKETGEIIECDFLGLTPGVSPNIDFLKDSGLDLDRGIMVNEYLETNKENVYALGDCAQFLRPPGKNRRNIEQVWYTGRMMGECLGKTLSGNKTPYKPGVWFNSAKFFDIEYQTYGWVFPRQEEDQTTFFWKHPKKDIALRLVFKTQSNQLLGVNAFGIRLRHQLLDEILSSKGSAREFLRYFKDYVFDPEFFTNHGREIVKEYNQEFEDFVELKSKSWNRIKTVLNKNLR